MAMVEKLFLFIHHLGSAGLLDFGGVLILYELGKSNEEENCCVGLENLKFDDVFAICWNVKVKNIL